MKRFALISFLLAISSACLVFAEKPQDNKNVPALMQDASVKTMIDLVSRSVARRYDLRPDQADVARNMLLKNTQKFMQQHFNDLVVLIPKMQDMRMKAVGGHLSPTEVQDLARKLAPIYKDATELIVSENDKFHEILDGKQKAIHQRDMDQMKTDVALTRKKLSRWKEGGYKEGEFLNDNRPRNKRGQKKPPVSVEPKELMSMTSVNYWELFVKTFVESYQLDQGQIPMAYSILNEMKDRAKAYREDHSRQYAEIKKNLDQLAKVNATQPDQKEALKTWQKKLEKLEQPLLDMFNELKDRLMAIPTDEQRKAFQETSSGAGGQKTPLKK
ncbi:MAG: hypothetical protein WC975_13100 [Phycisphaerae bacterium]